MRRENEVRTPTGTFVAACALSAALLVAGCGGDGDKDTKSSGEIFLQPAAAQGPDAFTGSTATSMAAETPEPARSAQPAHTPATPTGLRSVSGSTPGLYGGTERVGSCDVERQIDYLTSDRSRARAFAQVEGISQASVPGYLRGLAPVALRADTRVTNHGFSGGRATGYQSVLQAGTAVLVDNRGVPRVRCACGNPLKPATAMRGSAGSSGRPWSGYRPAQVVVVTPAPQVITNITIINVVNNTWIERWIGHDVRHDHVVPPPMRETRTPSPDESRSSASPVPPREDTREDSASPGDSSASFGDGDERTSPSGSATDCATPAPTVTVTPAPTVTVTPSPTDDTRTEPPSPGPATDCPTATVTATPPTTQPDGSLVPPDTPAVPDTGTTLPEVPPDTSEGIGPESVPETPDLRDGGGLIPDDPDATDATDATDSVFGSPTDVFDG